MTHEKFRKCPACGGQGYYERTEMVQIPYGFLWRKVYIKEQYLVRVCASCGAVREWKQKG